ncbi:hypothetical protein D3C80_1506820 [compost metagenome]
MLHSANSILKLPEYRSGLNTLLTEARLVSAVHSLLKSKRLHTCGIILALVIYGLIFAAHFMQLLLKIKRVLSALLVELAILISAFLAACFLMQCDTGHILLAGLERSERLILASFLLLLRLKPLGLQMIAVSGILLIKLLRLNDIFSRGP